MDRLDRKSFALLARRCTWNRPIDEVEPAELLDFIKTTIVFATGQARCTFPDEQLTSQNRQLIGVTALSLAPEQAYYERHNKQSK
jgi:hypothetical protein